MLKLRELRMENGLKRSDLARQLKIPASTLANYENGTREAPHEVLIILANFFDVSIDSLLGREELDSLPNPNEYLISQKERELIALYRSCDTTGRQRIEEYALLWKNRSGDK